MRHNDARKWLHAGLDLLPLILIPVFMIYSNRHTVTQQTNIDIQYKYQTNEVNTFNDIINGNVYHCNDVLQSGDISYSDVFSLTFLSGYIEFDSSGNISYADDINNSMPFVFIYTTNNTWEWKIDNGSFPIDSLYIEDFDFSINVDLPYDFFTDNNFDVNDFTSSNFNVIESVDVQDTNSSVMNVFMDNFNTAIDKYFNMGNVFNLNGVYQWFNTNIFGGNAPTIIYSVWNIALYELVMDLLFLLYGLFMWFIDICKHLMEKPFRSIK